MIDIFDEAIDDDVDEKSGPGNEQQNQGINVQLMEENQRLRDELEKYKVNSNDAYKDIDNLRNKINTNSRSYPSKRSIFGSLMIIAASIGLWTAIKHSTSKRS